MALAVYDPRALAIENLPKGEMRESLPPSPAGRLPIIGLGCRPANIRLCRLGYPFQSKRQMGTACLLERAEPCVSALEVPATLMSSLPGLYLAGEGAGYAGGIVSAGLDGLRLAETILTGKPALREKTAAGAAVDYAPGDPS